MGMVTLIIKRVFIFNLDDNQNVINLKRTYLNDLKSQVKYF
jgi:hypothetical protein